LGFDRVRSLDDMKALGAKAAKDGFRALKTNPMRFSKSGVTGFNPGFLPDMSAVERGVPRDLVRSACDLLEAFRDGTGGEVGLMLDLNFSMRPAGCIAVGRALERFGLEWLEVDQADATALAGIRAALSVPVASLEAIYGAGAYRPFLQSAAADIAIVDVIWNGLLESVRIAALADAHDVAVAPHNFYGDLGSAISAHFSAAVPNLRIMEFEVDDAPWRHDFVTKPLVVDNGEIVLADEPGWGLEVNEEGVRAHPVKS
jgi:L-alanine-DL-glutamate epimerase-like enolase superfamily enzyme